MFGPLQAMRPATLRPIESRVDSLGYRVDMSEIADAVGR